MTTVREGLRGPVQARLNISYTTRPVRLPARNIATELKPAELTLLREAIEANAPDLAFLLTDPTHQVTLAEADRLVDAVADELGKCPKFDERFKALDDLIGRVNWGPFLR